MDFGYLYKQARIESGLRPDAKARTSSATGLYQFIDQSWLAALKRHGAKHGLQWAADCIAADRRGRLCVTDPGARAAIMNLRNERSEERRGGKAGVRTCRSRWSPFP